MPLVNCSWHLHFKNEICVKSNGCEWPRYAMDILNFIVRLTFMLIAEWCCATKISQIVHCYWQFLLRKWNFQENGTISYHSNLVTGLSYKIMSKINVYFSKSQIFHILYKNTCKVILQKAVVVLVVGWGRGLIYIEVPYIY